MSPGHCEYCVFYCVFVTPWRSLCEQGFRPSFWCICVNAHMNAILLQVLQVQESHRTTWFPMQGSPCAVWLGLCECFVHVNVLFQWVTDPTSCPVSPLFVFLSFRAFLALPGMCELLAFCLIPVSGPFCRSRVNTGYIPIFPVLFLTRLCHLQPILYKVCNSSILARGSLFFPGNTVLIYCSICAIHDALCKNVKWELGSYK